ncbi:MAG: PAS domain S-box protein [Verrucomicrobiales bacterium]|nr:PAS domain S-box protein [Verrucomicrobiales bacterium]
MSKQEIEALRRAQAALETSRNRYLDLYEQAPAGYLILDEHGLIQDANLAAATLLGTRRDALPGQSFRNRVALADQRRYEQHWQSVAASGGPEVCEVRLVSEDAAPRWAQIETNRADLPGPGPSLRRMVISDITRRKQADAEQAEADRRHHQLQKADSLGRMAGAIAHRFNSLLGAVMGNLELALEDGLRDEGSRVFLTEALEAARRAADISGLMLTYLGQTPVPYDPLELVDFVRQGLPSLRTGLRRGQTLDAVLPDARLVVCANADQLQEVLGQLVTNAVEASGERPGAIRLELSRVAPTAIPTAHRFPVEWQPQEPSYVRLEVRDNGGGIAAPDLNQVFDPFFSRKLTGRGLGLSVVLGIVQAHRGAVTVASEPGRGSVFTLYLPEANAGQTPPPPAPEAKSPAHPGGPG